MSENHQFAALPEFTNSGGRELSSKFFGRLLAFYDRQADSDANKSEIWKAEERVEMVALTEALTQRHPGILAELLNSFCAKHPVYGMHNPCVHSGTWAFYCLGAANAVGVLPVHDVDQPDENNPRRAVDLGKTIVGIEDAIGGTLTHPGGAGLLGAKVGNRFIPYQLLEAVIYFMAAKRFGLNIEGTFLEIGGGVGFAGYLFHHLCPQSEAHFMDLPKTSVIQAFFLALAFGESAVCLDGETESGQKVFIHGTKKPAGTRFDFVLNTNSMPEMLPDQIDGYLGYIIDRLKASGHFLSVNREGSRGGQTPVHSVAKNHLQLKLRSRTPAWMWPNLVQEIWTL